MNTPCRPALVARLAGFDPLVEVGIGRRTDVAAALARAGHEVVAIDVHERAVPDGVRFLRADVTTLDPDSVAPVGAVYALNLPPELHRPTVEFARALAAPLLFTTLGFDEPAVAARRHRIDAGDGTEVLYVVDEG